MKNLLSVLAVTTALSALGHAQVGGGSAAYGQRQTGSEAAVAIERAKRTLTKDDLPPGPDSTFLDASVLINVKADEYVAVFSVSEEAPTLEAARQKADAAIAAFTADLGRLGVQGRDVFVDFVVQNRVYGYEVEGDTAKEKVVGFEVKKNVSVRYRGTAAIDNLTAAASRAGIFDLVKVDYVVRDVPAVHTRLMEEAAKVIRRKKANHERLLGVSLGKPGQVYAERYASHFPSEMYSSYVAQESESVSGGYRRDLVVQGARKPRSFYFDALNAQTFDQVVNPVVTEPVVQFTLYLKVKYDSARVKAPARKARS